jgi:hypothetical protein
MMAAITNVGLSQTVDDEHKALTAHHEKAKKHADAIATGEAKTKAEQVKHAEEATESLEKAKKSHTALKSAIPAKHKEAAKMHHATIERHHAEATKHSAALNAELKKASPVEKMVKEHAKNLSESVDKAEKENQALKTKTK